MHIHTYIRTYIHTITASRRTLSGLRKASMLKGHTPTFRSEDPGASATHTTGEYYTPIKQTLMKKS